MGSDPGKIQFLPNSGTGKKKVDPKACPKSICMLSPETFEIKRLSACRSPTDGNVGFD